MLIDNGLEEQMSIISQFNGNCLSIQERLSLETTLDQLKNEIQCDEILFWGKINGVEKDYYISIAVYYRGHPGFPLKKFYFCTSTNFNFSLISEIEIHQLDDLANLNTFFIGNPDVIIKTYPNDSNGKKQKNLTEGDRLSFLIRTIEHDTSVVPVGALKMLINNEMRKNESFTGLNLEEIKEIKNYVHFRPVECKNKKNLIALGDAVLNYEFLDSIQDDSIKGTWSIRLSNDGCVSLIRNNIWVGYSAYCKAGKNCYGGVYFGNGIKNQNIAFMQQ